MSKLEANTIDTVSGTTNLTIGSTNTSTITMPNGKLTGQNYPMFHATLTSDQSFSNNTATIVNFNSDKFDTDNAYNTSTYKFTPQKAGKYFVYSSVYVSMGNNNLKFAFFNIRKNTSNELFGTINTNANNAIAEFTLHTSGIIDLNGSSDYLQVQAQAAAQTNTSGNVFVGGTVDTFFGAYRIGA